MAILEVNSPETAQSFLDCVEALYRDHPNYIRPLDQDLSTVFDEKKNKFLRGGGEACRWIFQNSAGKTIGRVAAFHHPDLPLRADYPIGGMGFYECIDDDDVSRQLFDACKNWLAERGFKAMDGPVNFGQRDRFWGLLAEGRDRPPVYGMLYHPAYYEEHFRNYGFDVFFQQYTYGRELNTDYGKKEAYDICERFLSDPKFHIETASKKNLEKYAEDFRIIYNAAWGGSHEHFKTLSERKAMAIIKSIGPIMDEDIMIFYYYDNKPISFFIAIPDINRIIRDFNGKFGLWQKMKFMWRLKTGGTRQILGMVYGVVPEFQGKDVEGVVMITAKDRALATGRYDNIEMNWVGDFNPKMISKVTNADSVKIKTHLTMRYIWDEDIVFERHPII